MKSSDLRVDPASLHPVVQESVTRLKRALAEYHPEIHAAQVTIDHIEVGDYPPTVDIRRILKEEA